MATHKVAQNVEAEDKLLGPFTAKQSIYLAIVAVAGGLAWFLFQIFPPLVIIPLPIILFFGALSLPLKRDQPLETYFGALISFALKPKVRVWKRDGITSVVEIAAPKILEDPRKPANFDERETDQRLIFLSQLADTHGWAVRNTVQPTVTNTSMNEYSYSEAASIADPFDAQSDVGQYFNNKIEQSNEQRKQAIITTMRQGPQPPVQNPTPQQYPQQQPEVAYNPYPTSIHQSVIQPSGTQNQTSPATAPVEITNNQPTETPQQIEKKPETKQVPPDIIELANNSDLSVEAISHEAARRMKPEPKEDEVFISLHDN